MPCVQGAAVMALSFISWLGTSIRQLMSPVLALTTGTSSWEFKCSCSRVDGRCIGNEWEVTEDYNREISLALYILLCGSNAII